MKSDLKKSWTKLLKEEDLSDGKQILEEQEKKGCDILNQIYLPIDYQNN
jgi:hypothetical protein